MRIRQLPGYLLASWLMSLAIAVLMIAIVTQQITSSRLSSDIREQKESLKRSRENAESSKQTASDYSEISAKLGGRYKEVSWSTRMPFVISELAGITQAHRLKIENLKPEPVTSADEVSRLPMRITIKADIADLARVVEDIDKSIPYMDVERMDIHMASDKSDLLQCDMTVSSFAVQDENSSQPMSGIGTKKPKGKKAEVKVTGGKRVGQRGVR